jgi:hypothetical protein
LSYRKLRCVSLLLFYRLLSSEGLGLLSGQRLLLGLGLLFRKGSLSRHRLFLC